MPLLTSIAAYWKFDENNGSTTTADATGNGNTGTLTSSSQWTPSGKINAGITFNGSSQSVALAGSLPSTVQSALTMTAWVKTNLASTEQTIFEVGDTGSNPFVMYRIEIFSTGQLKFSLQTNNTAPSNYVGTTVLSTGAFHFCAATWDGTNVVVYLDNASEATGTQTGTMSTTGGAAAIGESPAFGSPFSGTIDEVGLWSRALSSLEISQLYNSGAGLQYPFSGGGPSGGARVLNLGWTPLFAAGAALIKNPRITRRGLIRP